jgi:molybdopterin molybdotransferase
MISVEEAWKIVNDRTLVLGAEPVALTSAVGRILAESIDAPISLPPFRQSAMDGYAVMREDLQENGNELKVVDEVPAGSTVQKQLHRGEAMRIFTGAPVPEGADFVVMQEYVNRSANTIVVTEKGAKTGANIRKVGEELMAGTLALPKGHELTAASCGFLSALGVTTVQCVRQPVVTILVTGDELVEPGTSLRYGQIYESNGTTLKVALAQMGITKVLVRRLADHYETTKSQLQSAVSEADVVLVSGGISVGDYDFVGKALEELKAKQFIYKIKQKPGKPMYFGQLQSAAVFGLPGNPASMLSCFFEYVYPVLRKMGGHGKPELQRVKRYLKSAFSAKNDRALFLKAQVTEKEVELLEGQGSFMMQSFAQANALVYLPAGSGPKSAGDEVEVHLLPF